MKFNKQLYSIERFESEEKEIVVRAFRNRVYVDKPVNEEFQQMHILVPEIYYQGANINGYSLHTAPIFVPNTVGGYKPGKLPEPGFSKTTISALEHGYVVATPAIRGRTQQNGKGEYTGKAPACIVDYKAAIRYLRFFRNEIPGDVNKIITNGTSAGGALSSLMGSTGEHPDYESYLEEIGAAKESDEIYAASCYCPITNLDYADIAYEWQFGKAGKQTQVSEDLEKMFPIYLNGLNLKDEKGVKLVLDENGEGTFKKFIEKKILESAKEAISREIDISDKEWLTIKAGKVEEMDFGGYVKDITRMKEAPAFDKLSMESFENDLFGTKEIERCHFTEYSMLHSAEEGIMADKKIIKMLNPMNYINDAEAKKAKYFRIRHGECDRDTSLAISAILSLKLQEIGKEVDYHIPWGIPHAGDYDLPELFAWIDRICK